jgi:hypothetical protein
MNSSKLKENKIRDFSVILVKFEEMGFTAQLCIYGGVKFPIKQGSNMNK